MRGSPKEVISKRCS